MLALKMRCRVYRTSTGIWTRVAVSAGVLAEDLTVEEAGALHDLCVVGEILALRILLTLC